MEFEVQWGFANYMILLVKEVPILHDKHTRYKQSIIRFHYGRCHTEMLCEHDIFNPLPVELENKNSVWSAKLRCAPGRWCYHICHLNVAASHSFKTKQLQRLFAEWGASGVMMSTCWIKSQPWETIEIADHSPSCWIWLDWYAWYAAFSLVAWSMKH